ncbi:MAG: hypothetical protein ACEQSB_07170 [Undibacterium sp.]
MNESPITREELYQLHTLLGRYEVLIAHKEAAPRWEGDDFNTIREVSQMIEVELSRPAEDEGGGGDDLGTDGENSPKVGPVSPGGDVIEVPGNFAQIRTHVVAEPIYA